MCNLYCFVEILLLIVILNYDTLFPKYYVSFFFFSIMNILFCFQYSSTINKKLVQRLPLSLRLFIRNQIIIRMPALFLYQTKIRNHTLARETIVVKSDLFLTHMLRKNRSVISINVFIYQIVFHFFQEMCNICKTI